MNNFVVLDARYEWSKGEKDNFDYIVISAYFLPYIGIMFCHNSFQCWYSENKYSNTYLSFVFRQECIPFGDLCH